jgi:hypothetical protein
MYCISIRGQQTGGDPLAWGLGWGLTTPYHKTSNLLRTMSQSLGTERILRQYQQGRAKKRVQGFGMKARGKETT